MKQIELIILLFVIVLYLWWRVRRRIEQIKTRFRGERRPTRRPAAARREVEVPQALTLEKDPVTGIYRPPED